MEFFNFGCMVCADFIGRTETFAASASPFVLSCHQQPTLSVFKNRSCELE